MLKLKLSDGECMIHAIEVIKIQQLSLYIKPGCKLLICPPVKLRKGVFLLKPNNCRVIGGEYLPALEEFRPLDQYKKLLKIEGKCKPIKEKPKPPPPPTPTIPDATTSPDVFNDFPDDVFEDFPNENPVVTVSNISQRLPNEQFDCDSPSIKPKIARVTPKVQKTEIAGTLSTQRAPPPPLDIRIEDDEEPINYEPKKHDNSLNLSVKTEIVDSDIEIIHLDDDEPTTIQAVKEEPQKPKTNPLVEAFNALKCSDLNESQRRMKYIIGSKKFLILAFVHDILEPLRVVDNLWTMKVKLKDDSGTVDSFVDNATLEKMIGYTCQEAIEIRKSSDIEKRKDGKRRLKALENQLQRLDLIMEIEFFNGSTSVPVIRSIKTLAEQLDAY